MTRVTIPTRTIVSLAALAAAVIALASPGAVAQTNVTATNKYAWSENCGFLNWRDAGSPVGAQGAFVGARFLFGYVWGENIGWIHLGDGAPANGVSYSNPIVGPVGGVPDFGVNRDPATGNLTGFAWSENVGWINFSGGALATPAIPARFDAQARRLRGYAWGENIGWINLNDSADFVSTFCPADFNQDGVRNVSDIFAFLTAWFAQNGLAGPGHTADFNNDNIVNVTDIFAFLAAWFAGCA